MFRRILTRWLIVATSLLLPFAAAAQAWPTKPVKIIVPFAAGGATDVVARLLAQKLSDAWGQSVVVENRAGAGGNIGADAVAKSPPDGYTLLVSTNGVFPINKALYRSLPFDPDRDLAPVSLLATAPQMLVVVPSLGLKDFK